VDYWIWFALGAVLLIVESLVPGAAFMWFGFSALLVGVLTLIAPQMPLGLQLLMFALLAGVSLWAWKRYSLFKPARESDQPLLNQRDQQLLGRVLVLETAIDNGRGQARVNDSLWLVEGPDLPAGAHIRVVAAEGTVLKVEPI